jgi:CxxC-x17-CxxC domain-containing protein
MKTSYHSNRDSHGGGYAGGKKSYGSGGPRRSGGGFGAGHGGGFNDRGGDRFDRPQLHEATCAKCGKTTTVPFKPNGSKPVYCRDCFKKEDGGGFESNRFERPSYGEKRPFNRFEDRPEDRAPSARPAADLSKIEARLASIEKKLDMLIESVTVDEDEDDDDEEEGGGKDKA